MSRRNPKMLNNVTRTGTVGVKEITADAVDKLVEKDVAPTEL